MRKTALICAVIVLVLFTGCSSQGLLRQREQPQSEYGSTQLIGPNEEGLGAGQVRASVYYRYMDEALLAPVVRSFQLGVEKSLAYQLIEATILGPEELSTNYNALFLPQTSIVEVVEQSGYLSVTLSSDFLYAKQQDLLGRQQRADQQTLYLRTYSIVNAIAGLGQYPRVRIRVERENGSVSALYESDIKPSEADAAVPLEALGADTSMVLTPEKVLSIAIEALTSAEDWERLDRYLAKKDWDGATRPLRDELQSAFLNRLAVVQYEVEAVPLQNDGANCTLLINISYLAQSGQIISYEKVPIRLYKEDVWKVAYASLSAAFMSS